MIGETLKATLYTNVLIAPKLIGKLEGEIIFENDFYYTIQCKNYQTSINKAGIITGEVVLR